MVGRDPYYYDSCADGHDIMPGKRLMRYITIYVFRLGLSCMIYLGGSYEIRRS